MRIKSKARDHFWGTHKGYDIQIERERGVERGERKRFYILVRNEYGAAYDGYSPPGVDTMAEAKREALKGAQIA